MNRIIISYEDEITPIEALESIKSVVKLGKISEIKGKPQYCFITLLNNRITIYAREKYNLKSDSFIVLKRGGK